MVNLRILLVDDDRNRTDRLVALLASENHALTAVPDVAEAGEALSIQRFDVVLFSGPQPDDALSGFAANARRQALEQSEQSPVVLLSCWPENRASSLDGHLDADFTPGQLAAAVARSSSAGRASESAPAAATSDLPVFLPDRFEDQCIHDSDLMIEVIDLFSAEREPQLVAMADALGASDFERLARAAHTLKGSVGSLHAPLARWRTQELELAAKARNGALCAQILDRLEHDLTALDARLGAFRLARQGR